MIRAQMRRMLSLGAVEFKVKSCVASILGGTAWRLCLQAHEKNRPDERTLKA